MNGCQWLTVFLVILVIIFLWISSGVDEGFGGSTGGGVLQLRAVGPMDSYLIGDDALKYGAPAYPGYSPYSPYLTDYSLFPWS